MTARSPATVEYDSGLVEEAVLRALAGQPLELRYRRERERCYRAMDEEEREGAFRALDARFLGELGLDRPLQRLCARPTIAARVARVAVARAPSPREEGADVFAPRAGEARGVAIGVALTAETLAAPARLESLLEREALYLEDLLDPDFAFDPRLDGAAAGPVQQNLLRDRYRVLWGTTVAGRLARRRGGDDAARERCRRELIGAFPRLTAGEAGTEQLLTRLFDGSRPGHVALLALAAGATAGTMATRAPREPGAPCVLCRFPSHAFESPAAIEPVTRAAIAADFPVVVLEDGVCRQCADLYRARAGAG